MKRDEPEHEVKGQWQNLLFLVYRIHRRTGFPPSVARAEKPPLVNEPRVKGLTVLLLKQATINSLPREWAELECQLIKLRRPFNRVGDNMRKAPSDWGSLRQRFRLHI